MYPVPLLSASGISITDSFYSGSGAASIAGHTILIPAPCRPYLTPAQIAGVEIGGSRLSYYFGILLQINHSLTFTLYSPHRYTKKIRYLDIEQCDQRDDDVDQIAYSLKEKQFTFPHVKSVIIDLGSENMDEKVMAQFLSHGLITLELYGGHYTRWFLSQIQVSRHQPL